MEIWKDVVGFENYFSVSDAGRVYSKRSNKILSLHTRKDRRITVSTKIGGRNGIAVTFKVHRLVAEAFIPNPDNKPQVNHIDGNPSNNNKSNLEWVSASENIKHAYQTGLNVPKKGVLRSDSSLSSSQVEYIRSNPEKLTVRELAAMFKVHHSTIVRCKNYKRYAPVV